MRCARQVRFDLPATLLAFIQSRGRARVRASHVVLMLAAGNAEQREIVENVRMCAGLDGCAVLRKVNAQTESLEMEAVF